MIGETVSTVKRASFLLALYIFSMLAVAAPAAAQNPTPTAAISVTCAPSNINVEVKPGSTYSGFTTCTATNPTAYQEKISINVQADGLATAAPGDMYVGAGDSVDFQVSVRALHTCEWMPEHYQYLQLCKKSTVSHRRTLLHQTTT